MKIKFRFRIIATDSLITNSSSGLSVTYVITDGTTKYSGDKRSIPNNLSYSLGNGGKAYYRSCRGRKAASGADDQGSAYGNESRKRRG